MSRSSRRAPWRGVGLFVLLLAGCQFDGEVSGAGSIRCDDGVCPTGFVCRTRLHVCVRPTGDAPGEAARVVSSSVTPPRARSGEVVRIALTVSQPLAAPPQVNVLEPSGPHAATLASQSATAFDFTYTVDRAVDDEGSARVLADLVDVAGTENLGQVLGVVTFDFSPPSVLAAAWTAPRSADDAGLLTARAAELLSLRVLLSEPVAAGASVAVSPDCDGGLSLTLRSAEGTALEFFGVAPAQACEPARLTLSPLTDLVGNGSGATALEPRVAIDGQPPRLSNLRLLRPTDGGLQPQAVFSRVPGFERYVVAFDVDSSAATVTARLDERPLETCACAAGSCQCPGAVGAADSEGPHSFFVTASDLVVNTATASVQARFDFTPPGLVPGSVRTRIAPPLDCPLAAVGALPQGGTATLELSLTEDAELVLEASPQVLVFQPTLVTPTHASFSAALAPGAPDGPVSVAAVATDAVGNSARLAVVSGVAVDGTPPAVPDVASPAAIVYRREPWGSRDAGPRYEVRGAPGATQGDWVQVLGGASVLAVAAVVDGGFTASLPDLDRTVVSVRALDAACNRSAAADVRNVEWLATLRGKVLGRTFENPHTLEAREVFSNATTQPQWTAEVAPAPGLVVEGRLGWRELGAQPPGRTWHEAAYDSARGRLVVFGGMQADGGQLNDVWELDTATDTWANRTPAFLPAAWPGARVGHALTFDATRGKVVLFGGMVGPVFTNDLWEWDGASGTWVNRTPSTLPTSWPSPRMSHLVFDSARGKVVLFGGRTSNIANDVWEWDGTAGAWTNRTPSPLPTTWPVARTAHGLAYDAARAKVVLFGGNTVPTARNDLWEWDPVTGGWTNRTPTTLPTGWPSARSGHGLSYDAARGKVVLFGGDDGSRLNDFREWDGAAGTWTARAPASPPSGRALLSLTYDAARARFLLFGGGFGTSTAVSNELWDWNGATNALVNRTASAPSVRPPAHGLHGSTYDSTRGKLIVFGGFTDSGPTNDLWELDSATGTWAARGPGTTTPWPVTRFDHAMAFDSARGRAVSYGGSASTGTSELWEWDGAGWLNRTPTTLPPGWPAGRTRHGATYDAARRKVVVFGGQVGTSASNELWEWDGQAGTWANRTPLTLPAAWPRARTGPLLTYDAGRARVVMFGGFFASTSTTADLWEWDGQSGTWADRTPTPLPGAWPTARNSHGLTYDPVRAKVLLFGGSLYVAGVLGNDLWEWSGGPGTWRSVNPTPLPAPWPGTRYTTSLNYDSVRKTVLAFGGAGSNFVRLNETWELSGDTTTRPGLVAKLNVALSGAEAAATVTSLSALAVAGASSGAGQPGVDLFVTSGEVMAREASAAHAVGSAGPVSWQSSAATRLATALEGPERRVSVAVTPSGNNREDELARLALEWVELLVAYRRP